MLPEKLLSIGVYGFDEKHFFDALVAARVDLFCDVRARRGLRGSEYAFANAGRLTRRLNEIGISYVHLKDLAPTAEIRDAQHAEDARLGNAKRSREMLGEVFKTQYAGKVLSGLDANLFLATRTRDARRPVFFCVERAPAACHRSLLIAELSHQTGLPVEHLMP